MMAVGQAFAFWVRKGLNAVAGMKAPFHWKESIRCAVSYFLEEKSAYLEALEGPETSSCPVNVY